MQPCSNRIDLDSANAPHTKHQVTVPDATGLWWRASPCEWAKVASVIGATSFDVVPKSDLGPLHLCLTNFFLLAEVVLHVVHSQHPVVAARTTV